MAIVQIGTWVQSNVVVIDELIEVRHELGIGPSLVGRMKHLAFCTTDPGSNDRVFGGRLDIRPLLEFDNDSDWFVFFVEPGNDKIDSFGRLGDLVLDRNPSVGRDRGSLEHVSDEVQGVLKRLSFARRGVVSKVLAKGIEDSLSDPIFSNRFTELGFGRRVDDHRGWFGSWWVLRG